MTVVDIAVACMAGEPAVWWSRVWNMLLFTEKQGIEIGKIHAFGSAIVDTDKNRVVKVPVLDKYAKRRNSLTDANRVAATSAFMEGDADYVFWMDNDTVPPVDAIVRLLEARREITAGVYFNTNEPHLPIAYVRQEDGFYFPVPYRPGGLSQVDSVGMGCTLIHRSVYEKIESGYTLVQLPNAVLYPVLNENIMDRKYAKPDKKRYVRGGYLHIPLSKIENDNRYWPFYALEHGRTEDHWFNELAAGVGIKPWLDYTVICEHVKLKATTIDAYERWQRENAPTD